MSNWKEKGNVWRPELCRNVRNLNKVTIQVTMRTWWFPFPYTGSLKSVPKFSSFKASQVLMMVGSGRARAGGGCV